MKRSVFILLVLISVCSIMAVSQSVESGTIKIYLEVAGDYEYYSDMQYNRFHIYVERARLLLKGSNSNEILTVTPDDLPNLQFRVSDCDETQSFRFNRNKSGEVTSCRFLNKGDEYNAIKLNVKDNPVRIAEKVFSTAALKSDLTFIKEILINNHPAVYQFTGETLFLKIFSEQMKKINRPMNLKEFYMIASPLVESVHCGHTVIFMPSEFWNNENEVYFPVRLIFIGQKAYVNSFYFGKGTIPAFSEVVSVNNIPMAEIIESAKKLLTSDGENESFKLEKLRVEFQDYFNILYGDYDRFDVGYKLPGSELVNLQKLKAGKRCLMRGAYIGTNYEMPLRRDSILSFEIFRDKKVAVLTIHLFFYPRDNAMFYSFLDKAFAEIHKNDIRSLILDLRNNTGGEPGCSSYLFSYLESRPSPFFAGVYYGYDQLASPVPLAGKNAFSGNLVVLINGACFSATGHLCSLLKYQNRGIFVGEQTGGTYECNGAAVKFNSRETRMTIMIPQRRLAAAVTGISRENGIMPDYYVEPAIEDLLEGKDTAKEFAFGLTQKSDY